MLWTWRSAHKRLLLSRSQKELRSDWMIVWKKTRSGGLWYEGHRDALMGFLTVFLMVTPSLGQLPKVSAFQTKAQAATSSGKPFTGLTLSANADWIAGSAHERGTAKLEANADGSGSVQLEIGDASRTEVQTKSGASRSCTWTDYAGASHVIVGPNCLIAMPWFAPSLFTQPLSLLSPILFTTDVGEVLKDGVTLHQVNYQLDLTGADNASTQVIVSQSTVQVFYDPQTFLPQSLEYAVHPDNNDLLDVPVRVVFTNYQDNSGVMLPSHIERYINHTLQLTLDVKNASLK